MKKGVLCLALLALCLAPLSAQDGAARSWPWSPPVPSVTQGRAAIAVGFWADVIGLGLIAGGGAAYSSDTNVANALIGVGLTSMLFIGNPCLQLGLGAHHRAVVEKGFTVNPGNKNKSRTLSLIALACGGGSLALGVFAITGDSLGMAIASNVVGLAGAVVEIVNFYVFRRNWGLDLKRAAGVPVK